MKTTNSIDFFIQKPYAEHQELLYICLNYLDFDTSPSGLKKENEIMVSEDGHIWVLNE
ncbi:hypothetical protein DJ87_3421 [Bacillus cereus]|uniref:hypothetical protein n=1 Tax=Bacillus TaxID=1386 RepID=UPI0005069445|nr:MULTISPECIES: hypothetical protein [Bacillus]MCZ2990715.1 hypothetical protein [Acinetobacter baumannii]HDR7923545.1 hypothetical protein [Bacillus paranthracis]HDX9495713.1 hypothetical protein [Bacillus thuringiensis]KFK72129.1 hypothetical protein DJ87_3421 [Bacillus cereus]MDA1515582.1 hypothetical protein [Bacillus cereus group sp. TH40LC]